MSLTMGSSSSRPCAGSARRLEPVLRIPEHEPAISYRGHAGSAAAEPWVQAGYRYSAEKQQVDLARLVGQRVTARWRAGERHSAVTADHPGDRDGLLGP